MPIPSDNFTPVTPPPLPPGYELPPDWYGAQKGGQISDIHHFNCHYGLIIKWKYTWTNNYSKREHSGKMGTWIAMVDEGAIPLKHLVGKLAPKLEKELLK